MIIPSTVSSRFDLHVFGWRQLATTSLERRLLPPEILVGIPLPSTPCEIPDDAPLLLATLQDPLVDTKPFQPYRTPRMRLARGDPYFRPEPEPLSIGKPRRGVDKDVGRRYAPDKVGRVEIGRGEDRVRVM